MTKARAKSRGAGPAGPAIDKTPAWPAYTVEKCEIVWLKAYERNAKEHPEKQIEELRASLRQFGWTIPLLAREDGTIIAGHGRVEAARREGYTHAPVIIARGWTEEQCRAYTLADNTLAEGGKWNKELRALELSDLSQLGKLDLTSFGLKPLGTSKTGAAPNASPQLGSLDYSIVVRCKDEPHQAELLEKLESEGLTCEALIS